jgi:hypothetical protein
MYDWLASIAAGWNDYVLGLPIYLAAPAMIVIGALDSSLLSLPEINDYLVVGRCIKEHHAVFYFPLFAAIGSGSGLFIALHNRCGAAARPFCESGLAWKAFGKSNVAYARFWFPGHRGAGDTAPAIAVQIFVATAGTLEYPRWKSLTYRNAGTFVALLRGRYPGSFLRQESVAILQRQWCRDYQHP